MASLESDFVDNGAHQKAIVVEADEGSIRAIDDIVALRKGKVYRQVAYPRLSNTERWCLAAEGQMTFSYGGEITCLW